MRHLECQLGNFRANTGNTESQGVSLSRIHRNLGLFHEETLGGRVHHSQSVMGHLKGGIRMRLKRKSDVLLKVSQTPRHISRDKHFLTAVVVEN